MTVCVTRLTLATPQNSTMVAAVETASNQKGARSPILRLLAASVTASEPKDSQIAIPATNAVRMVGTDTRRMAAAYVKITRGVAISVSGYRKNGLTAVQVYRAGPRPRDVGCTTEGAARSVPATQRVSVKARLIP